MSRKLHSGSWRVKVPVLSLAVASAFGAGTAVGRAVVLSNDAGWRSRPIIAAGGVPLAAVSGSIPSEPRVGREETAATGRHQGRDWTLAVARAQFDNGEQGVCFRLSLSSTDRGQECLTAADGPLGPGRYITSSADYTREDMSVYYGTVSPEVATVELALGGGETSPGRVHEAPPTLNLPYNLFTAFAPRLADVAVVARDSQGEVLDRDSWAALPTIAVTRVGDGHGSVLGITPCPGCSTQHRPQVRISCGHRCFAEIAPEALSQDVELRAEPQPGSVFTGWDGACTGAQPVCVVRVDSHRRVVARFDAGP